jgi:hypothetical protein
MRFFLFRLRGLADNVQFHERAFMTFMMIDWLVDILGGSWVRYMDGARQRGGVCIRMRRYLYIAVIYDQVGIE